MRADPDIDLLLPYDVPVRENKDREVTVAFTAPETLMALVNPRDSRISQPNSAEGLNESGTKWCSEQSARLEGIKRKAGAMTLQLFFTNLPYNCSDRELKEWIESQGIETRAIRIIRDVVSGASPSFAYADLKDDTQLTEAISMLDGRKMRNQTISVTKAAHPVESTTARIAKA